VAGTNNRVFDVSFAAQTAAGAYSLRIGPEVKDVSGTRMLTYTTTFRVVAIPPRIVSASAHGLAQNRLMSVRVTFDRAVTPATFSPGDVRLVGPGGRAVRITAVRAVAGTNSRAFDVSFAAQTAAGAYSLRIGPEVKDVSGTRMLAYTTTFRLNAPAPRPAPAPRIITAVGNGLAQNRLVSVRVTFDRAVSPSTFTAGDIGLVGPGGRAVRITAVRAVAGTNNRVFDVGFAAQTAAGAYSLRIGPEVKDVSGARMLAYTTTFKVNAPAPRPKPTLATYTSTTAAAILPRGRAVTLLTVNSNVRVADLNVRLNIRHPRISDLYIHLQGPDGTNIVLFNRSGGNTANLTNTVFDDQGNTHIALGRGPFTGSYQPMANLSNFTGKLARGTWKLWIEDRAGVNRGTLANWSLTINPRA
jgi:subtilisin-like proprotein convertase family protein